MTDATRTVLYWAALFVLIATTPVVSNRVELDAANAATWGALGLGIGAACLVVGLLVWRSAAQLQGWTPTALTSVAIGATFSVGVGGGAELLGLSTAQSRVSQLIVDLAVASVGSGLLIMLVQRADAQAARRAALVEEAVALHLAREDNEHISERIRLSLESSVDDALGPARTVLAGRLDDGLLTTSERWEAVARVLRETADRTVRDVSRRLWREVAPPERSLTLTALLRDIVARQPFPVGTIILMYVIVSPTEVVRYLGPVIGMLNVVGGVALIGLVLGGANRLMRRMPDRHATIFVAAVVVLQAFTPLMFVWRDLWSDVPYRLSDLIAAVVFGVLIIVLASGAGSLRHLRTAAEEQVGITLAQDHLDVLAANRRLAQLARESARVLHGKVQTRLIACAIAIERAAETDDTQAFLAAMHEARDALGSVSLEDGAPSTSVRDEVARKAALWSGLCRVDVDVDDGADALLSPARIRDVGRVVEEGLSNAVRHGHATSIRVRVRVDTEADARGSVVVEVEDDGGGPAGGRPGLGSALLDSMSDAWELRAVDGGSILTVPLGPADAESHVRDPDHA